MSVDYRGLVLARYGEIALKGKNRPRFINRLRQNISVAMRWTGIQAEATKFERRIYVATDEPERAAEAMRKVFGLVSVSPVVRVPVTIEAMVVAAMGELEKAGISTACSFRVQARRSDKSFSLTSLGINREVGGLIQERTGMRVDLSDEADFTVGIEVQRDHALVYARVLPTAGGMPVPLSGRVVALISSGLDSPVAAWMMMKRGCSITPLHFKQSDEGEARFLQICDVLQTWSHGWKLKPVVVSHHDAFAATCGRLVDQRLERWTCVFCKRTMVGFAARLGLQHGAGGVVLGDSLGQVASQTLENLRIVSSGCELPILRPLIGLDKVEIMDLARRVGTYDISAQAAAPCPFLPERPLTLGRYERFVSIQPLIEGDGPDQDSDVPSPS